MGHTDVVKILLEHNANVHAVDLQQSTALVTHLEASLPELDVKRAVHFNRTARDISKM